jgi:hypothetical protein
MDEIEKRCKKMLNKLKDIKRERGAILDDVSVDRVKHNFITMSDDGLLRHMAITFGKFAMCVLSTKDVMKAYGLAAAYFLAEEEAKARNLYP